MNLNQGAQTWRHELWEWQTGWLDLGMAIVRDCFFAQGVKNLTEKLRPDLLARCKPYTANEFAYVIFWKLQFRKCFPGRVADLPVHEW